MFLLPSVLARAEIQVVHAFELGPEKPQGRLLQGLDGNFYGTAPGGGDGGKGCIYRATPAGVMTNLASFFTTNGANPLGTLVQGSDGTLYGTTQAGGTNGGFGTVFSYTIGGALKLLYSFDNTHGATPQTGLTFGPDLALYGTTFNGGANSKGTVFRITTGGSLSTLYSFGVTNANPNTALCLGSDNNFYSGTSVGPANGAGAYNAGTLYRITPAGGFTQLVGLTNTVGTVPGNTFILGSDGAVYGTLQTGGSDNQGTAFRLATDGAFNVLASFFFANSTGVTRGGLTLLSGTNFYGTSLTGAGGDGSVFQLSVNTANFSNSVIHLVDTFSSLAKGSSPGNGLTLANDGKFYGVTTDGGSANQGMFYNVPVNGSIIPIAPFLISGGADSESQLTLGPDGAFYGTTYLGGPGDAGTVFRITTNGAYSQLATLGGTNGINPFARLCVGTDGALYGSASGGGGGNVGTLFRVTTNGGFRTIVTLTNNVTGGTPIGGLAVGPDSLLYGTTEYGGTNSGQGTIFRLNPAGTNFTLTNLLVFYGTNGANPQGTLLNGGDGFMYGTCFAGGTNGNGTIFRIDTNGTFNTVATFMLTNGYQPGGGLVRGADGAFYGGGFGNFSNSRRIYRVTTNGVLTSVFAFPNNFGNEQFGSLVAGADGYLYDSLYDGVLFRCSTNGVGSILSAYTAATGIQPFGPPIFGPDGNLYGTTSASGPGGGGSVYRFVFDDILSISRSSTSAVVTATGTSGGNYVLFASTNLLSGSWVNIGTATAASSIVQFTDPNAGTIPRRFYVTAPQ
ncbi:MAG: beta strand repeat-containing protein [Limisphaerales bacterium]